MLSPEAVKSEWVERELAYALSQKRYKDRILPVLKQACKVEKLSWTLVGLQYVRFAKNFEAGCQELLRAWGVKYKSAPKPARK